MTYKRNRYPDGAVYAEITDFNHPVITERINNYEDLFFIKSLKDICDYNGVKDVHLIIPCMFQQQHDRRFEYNQSFELRLACDFINSCNFSSVTVFHPHREATQMGLNNCNVQDNSSFIELVLKDIGTTPTLFSTDAGSFKWINKLADKLKYKGPVYAASKSRDLVTHKLTQTVEKLDFEGQDILVLDDLIVGGATFIGISELLKSKNVGKLYLAVSHITIKTPNKKLETSFDKIYSTNSKYDDYDLSNLKIFNLF
jgi:ribose-phosphate pyrophosphokinase